MYFEEESRMNKQFVLKDNDVYLLKKKKAICTHCLFQLLSAVLKHCCAVCTRVIVFAVYIWLSYCPCVPEMDNLHSQM